jgi:hypothetical protein
MFFSFIYRMNYLLPPPLSFLLLLSSSSSAPRASSPLEDLALLMKIYWI